MATCYRHPNRETGVSCSSCGRPICPDCMTPTPVGMRCPECARERTPVRTMRNIRSDPVVTYVLIAINVLAFIGEFASGGGGLATRGGGTAISDGGLFGPAIANQDEYYRLITSGFLHAGLIHIAFNMYLLYILGQILEPAIGRVRFTALYFTSLLGGDFGALLASPDAVTIGASGAVFGLMGAAVLTLRSRGFDPMASGIPLLIVFNLVLSVAIPGISIGGHIGGLIAGTLGAFALVEVGERPRLAVPGYLACAVIAVAAVAGSLAVAGGSGLTG
jgi:membrane associated rhomboid family serine protease